ncbi:MAG: hypothetical protein ACLU6Y_15745 [Ruminococcus sp.]
MLKNLQRDLVLGCGEKEMNGADCFAQGAESANAECSNYKAEKSVAHTGVSGAENGYNLYINYVLNPRVEDELLRPYRKGILSFFHRRAESRFPHKSGRNLELYPGAHHCLPG